MSYRLTPVPLQSLDPHLSSATPPTAPSRPGITVRMVTGDNATTAACIAQQAGILPPAADPAHLVVRGAATAASLVAAATSATASPAPTSSTSAYFTAPTTPLVLEGATFRQLVTSPDYPGARLPILGGGGGAGGGGGPGGGGVAPPAVNREAFLALWPRLRVLARCSPGDKFMLVTAVRQLREQGALEEVGFGGLDIGLEVHSGGFGTGQRGVWHHFHQAKGIISYGREWVLEKRASRG